MARFRFAATLALGPVVAALVCGGAAARPALPLAASGRPPPEGLQPGLFDADGRACVKQCVDDQLPCDPPSYKAADGRCARSWR